MNKPYSFAKSIKDKEQKILNYYKRINNIEQPKIIAVPKKRKITKKNISRDGKKDSENDSKKDNDKDSNKESENHIKSEKDEKDEKKLTKKRIVVMDD